MGKTNLDELELSGDLTAKSITLTDDVAINGTITVDDADSIVVGDSTLTELLAASGDVSKITQIEKALSGDLAFKCTPPTITTAATAQNVGTQQKIDATIAGSVTSSGGGNIDVTVTADGLDDGSKTVAVTVENSDDEEAVALAIQTALAADTDISDGGSGLFTVTVSGAVVTLTKNVEAANDDTMDFTIDTDTAEFEEDDPLEVTLEETAGVAPYTRTVKVQLVDSDDNVHTWFNGVVPVTIADNADGTASIATQNPEMVNGEMDIVVTLTGTWAGSKTNTLSVSQKTILGYTVSAKTSVETSS
jgi:hypothetical protein